MKAFILAAGKGERLRPLTDKIPKCLVPIQSVPILGIWLELCRRHNVDEVLVNTHSHEDSVKSYLRDHSHGVRVQNAEEGTLLGSAGICGKADESFEQFILLRNSGRDSIHF